MSMSSIVAVESAREAILDERPSAPFVPIPKFRARRLERVRVRLVGGGFYDDIPQRATPSLVDDVTALDDSLHRGTNWMEAGNFRRVITRFAPENMCANEPVLELVHRFADEKGCTPAQISLAWVLKGGEFIVPIPGMRSLERIEENLGAADVVLTDDEYEALTKALDRLTIHGSRDGKDIKKLGTVPGDVDR